MKVTDTLGKYCYPVSYNVDLQELNNSVNQLFQNLGYSIEWFLNKLSDPNTPVATINITHLPGLIGEDRWLKFNGNHPRTKREGANEKDFVEQLEETKGTYLGKVLDDVFSQHKENYGEEFYGRCQIIASRPMFGYRLHRDLHAEHRYHIPLITDNNFYFLFKDYEENMTMLHMPANGKVWYLNPKDIYHTVMHIGSQNRMHILLTS